MFPTQCFAPFALVLLAAVTWLRAADDQKKPKDDPKPANDYEQLAADTIKFSDDVTATLKTVKDGPSANAAIPKFDKYRERVLKLRERTEKLGKPDDAVRDATMKKFGPRLKESTEAVMKEQERIEGDEELAKLMADSLTKLKVFESKVTERSE